MTADELVAALAARRVWGSPISEKEYQELREETNIEDYNEGMEGDRRYTFDGVSDDEVDDFEWFVARAQEIVNGTS